MKKVLFHGISFIGRRKNNEDAILQLQIDNETWCFAVADGMGGTEGGEIASEETIRSLQTSLKAAFQIGIKKDNSLKDVLQAAIADAQKTITELINKKPHLNGMGTTLTVLLIHQGNCVWANIGDSRIYLLHDGIMQQLTVDHTYIEKYRQEHQQEVPESIAARYGSIITRAIGGEEDEADLYPETEDCLKVEPGMVFLLCSDGLITSKIADKGSEFLTFILHYKAPAKIAEQLVSKAFYDGSSDNISAIVVCVDKKPIKRTKRLPVYSYPPVENKNVREIGSQGRKKSVKGRLSPQRKLLFAAIVLLSTALIATSLFFYKENYLNNSQTETKALADSATIRNIPEKGHKADKTNPSENNASEANQNDNTVYRFTHQNLVQTRIESAKGISKLLVTFINDPKISKQELDNPIENVIKSILSAKKPAYINDIHYHKVIYDSLKKPIVNDLGKWKDIILADSNKSINYPKWVQEKHIIINKADSSQFVILELKEPEKVTSKDYEIHSISFAHESGLVSLSLLMARLYYDYFHEANIATKIAPLLQYMNIYDQNGRIEVIFGKPLSDGFEAKAITTTAEYIQVLSDETEKLCIDICVPVKQSNKNQVLRLGYVIN